MTVSEQIQEGNGSNSCENETQTEEEKVLLTSFVQEVEERLAFKSAIRSANQNVQNTRPSEASFGKLDSSLKKNTAFVKKIKNFSSLQLDTYLKDMSGLNLSKYISEIAAAIVEAKLKMTDVTAAIKLCSTLHQIYADFSQHLFENWQKLLSFKVGEKIVNPSKLRVDLRFYAELVSAGLFNNKTAFTLLGNVLTTLISMDRDDHCNISIVLSFCKHCGDDYAGSFVFECKWLYNSFIKIILGLVPRKMKELSEKYNIPIPKNPFLQPEKQQNVRALLKDYFASLSKHLIKDHMEMQDFEKQNRRILQTKGEVSQERKEKLEAMQIAFEKFLASTQSFSEVLDEDMPELKTQAISKDDEV